MAIMLSSNTRTEEELRDDLKRMGVDIQTPAPEAEAVTEESKVVETPESEQADKPGETIPAENASKTAAEPETAKPTQEASQDGKEPEPKPEANKSGKGFVRQIDKLERKAERLEADLEAERGSKTAIQRELDEVKAKLAELQPAPAKKEPDLERPKRPTRAQFEFDEEKYEAAMAEYDVKLDEYHEEKNAKVVESTLAERERARQEAERRSEETRVLAEFEERKSAESQEYEDWDELLGPDSEPIAFSDDLKPVLESFLVQSENPGHLLHYLAENPKDFERLETINPILVVRELTRLQDKAVKQFEEQHKQGEKPAASAATPEKLPTKPAPKPLKTPDAPIEPLGGRASTVTHKSLEKAAEDGPKAYREARQREIRERQAG